MRIAIVGGSGKEGRGLATGWARAGQEVIIGSRKAERAAKTAEGINAAVGRRAAAGRINLEAAAAGEIVVLTVPYAAHEETLWDIRDAVRGKILVDVTVPIDPANPLCLRTMPGGSAAEEAQLLLGPEVRVVSAFQNVSQTHLIQGGPIDCDVLVCGEDEEARRLVGGLAGLLGLRAVDAGPARNAQVVEGLTVLLLEINRRYKIKTAGIRVTGLPQMGKEE